MKIKFYSYGACKEVTGSKHFIEVDDNIIQIDSGMFQGKREESFQKNHNLNFSPNESKAILLTHGHFDHCGALPIMINNGFTGNIYSTSASRDISNIILFDSAYIQEKDFEYIKNKSQQHPERKLKAYEPLYNSAEVVKTMQNFVTVNYHREFFPAEGISATFFDAGHILGSASILLNIKNKLKIGFSGDLGRKNLPIIKDPEKMPDLDYLVLEGTYGNRLHDSIGMAKKEVKEVIKRAYNRNGKIITPAFTIERTQELIYIIHTLLLEKEIPEIQIFVDSPMAVNATSIFKLHSECFDKETYNNFTSNNIDPFGFDSIKYVTSVKESIEINSFKGPAIIISASGMAENGRILHHLKNNIEDPKNIIAIIGYMAEQTLGRKIVEREKEVKIFGKSYKVNAEIATLNAFSGHADYREIKEWVAQYDLKKLKKIFLVHGEEDALNHLKKELLSINVNDVEITEYKTLYDL